MIEFISIILALVLLAAISAIVFVGVNFFMPPNINLKDKTRLTFGLVFFINILIALRYDSELISGDFIGILWIWSTFSVIYLGLRPIGILFKGEKGQRGARKVQVSPVVVLLKPFFFLGLAPASVLTVIATYKTILFFVK